MCITLCWTSLKHSVKSFQRLFINTFLSSFDFELIIAERFHNIDVNLICSISGGSLFTVIYTKFMKPLHRRPCCSLMLWRQSRFNSVLPENRKRNWENRRDFSILVLILNINKTFAVEIMYQLYRIYAYYSWKNVFFWRNFKLLHVLVVKRKHYNVKKLIV